MEYKILRIMTRWYPTSTGAERIPVTAVLVAGEMDDYAAYIGIGSETQAQGIATFGDKLSFAEALLYFPYRLDETRYRL
jgi:hypothetical protein